MLSIRCDAAFAREASGEAGCGPAVEAGDGTGLHGTATRLDQRARSGYSQVLRITDNALQNAYDLPMVGMAPTWSAGEGSSEP